MDEMIKILLGIIRSNMDSNFDVIFDDDSRYIIEITDADNNGTFGFRIIEPAQDDPDIIYEDNLTNLTRLGTVDKE